MYPNWAKALFILIHSFIQGRCAYPLLRSKHRHPGVFASINRLYICETTTLVFTTKQRCMVPVNGTLAKPLWHCGWHQALSEEGRAGSQTLPPAVCPCGQGQQSSPGTNSPGLPRLLSPAPDCLSFTKAENSKQNKPWGCLWLPCWLLWRFATTRVSILSNLPSTSLGENFSLGIFTGWTYLGSGGATYQNPNLFLYLTVSSPQAQAPFDQFPIHSRTLTKNSLQANFKSFLPKVSLLVCDLCFRSSVT